DLGVLAESELWPNLILAAQARGARLALISARLSPASLKGWRRAPSAARAILGAFDLILARDEAAAEGLCALGAHVDGLADMKFGAAPLPAGDTELTRLRDAAAGRPVILAASTHCGEEAAILARFATVTCDGNTRPLLIFAPRHDRRGAEVEGLARAAGFTTARRSLGAGPAGVDVYVADTVGELGLWYRLAALAVLGGSLAPGIGGHNPLEPARLGCPFVGGPHTGDWPVFADMESRGATRRVETPGDLDACFRAAIEAPDAFASMAIEARRYVETRDAHAHAMAARVMDLLVP
ncbi:MAG: 3-deoxy-D-manno-octulosonic acid transferase, partial [Caulobacteraceae bacterium]